MWDLVAGGTRIMRSVKTMAEANFPPHSDWDSQTPPPNGNVGHYSRGFSVTEFKPKAVRLRQLCRTRRRRMCA
jgi:hypothetical protein